MQSKLDASLIRLDPPDCLTFKFSSSSRTSTSLNLKNLSENPVCFRVRVSAPKEFLVTPINGVVPPGEEAKINISFVAANEKKNMGQKFSVECSSAADVSLADWKNLGIQFKLTTRFDVEESNGKESEDKGSESRESFFSELGFDRAEGGLDEERKELVQRNTVLSGEIKKVQALIEKDSHKLKFSKDIEVISQEIGGKYAVPHLVLMFLAGMIIGFYILA
jgi:hypothetical protein